MKCQRCGSNAIKTKTSSVTDLGDVLIIIRNVPCYQCEHCDEIIYTGDMVANLEKSLKITVFWDSIPEKSRFFWNLVNN